MPWLPRLVSFGSFKNRREIWLLWWASLCRCKKYSIMKNIPRKIQTKHDLCQPQTLRGLENFSFRLRTSLNRSGQDKFSMVWLTQRRKELFLLVKVKGLILSRGILIWLESCQDDLMCLNLKGWLSESWNEKDTFLTLDSSSASRLNQQCSAALQTNTAAYAAFTRWLCRR